MHDPVDQAAVATLFVGSTTEPGPRALISAPEQVSSRVTFPEDGVFIVDAESGRVLQALPLARQPGADQVDGDVAHGTGPIREAEIVHNSVRDITPHLRLLRRARKRLKALAAANRRKDEFLATLSRELRGPLGSIQNVLGLLTSQAGETSARLGAQALIERQVRRMGRLVDDLLEVSWITHGRLRLRRERIDLRVVVNSAIETVQPDIQQRNHNLCAALPDFPIWLQADPWSARASVRKPAGQCIEIHGRRR